jgi:hypothetical protein
VEASAQICMGTTQTRRSIMSTRTLEITMLICLVLLACTLVYLIAQGGIL